MKEPWKLIAFWIGGVLIGVLGYKMLDPTMLGLVLAVVVTILVVMSYLFLNKEEGDFEKAYKPGALALLTESEKKKAKNANKKDKKKQQQQKDQKNSEDEEKPAKKEVQKPSEVQVNEPAKEVETPLQKTAPTPSPKPSPKSQEPEKKKPVKSVNPKDLDQKKLVARLSAIADLEEGYVQFLTTSFRDSDVLKNNLSSEVKALHKKLTESSQKVDRLQKEKSGVEQKEKAEQNKNATLAQKVQTLQARESELTQSIHSAQSALHARQQDHVKEAGQLRAKAQTLENEIRELKANNSKLSSQVKSNQQQLASAAESAALTAEIGDLKVKMQKLDEIATELAVAYEQKVEENTALSQQAAQLGKTVSELENALRLSKQDLAAQTDRESKKDAATKTLEEEKATWIGEKARMVEEYGKLKALVDGLNRDVAVFHEYKNEQEEMIEELTKKTNEELQKEREVFSKKEESLQKQLAVEQQKIAALEKSLAAEKDRIVEIPKNAVEEEVFELKKTNVDLAAAPSTSGGGADVDQLKAENAKLQEKNDELRQRNYTILEKTEEMPKKLANERKRVVAEVGKLVKKQFKAFDDETAYFDWISESVSGIEKSLAAPPAAPAQAPPTKAPKEAKPARTVPSGNEGECRKALQILLKSLDHIDKLVDDQERRHEAEKAKLLAQKA